MRLEVAAIACPPRDARAARLSRPAAFSASRIGVPSSRWRDLSMSASRQHAHERAAAGHLAPMAFFVGPRGDIDGEMRRLGILGQRARHFEPVDHAHHAVEPAAARLGVGVRADQDARPRLGAAAEHRADAVDHGLQACLLHAAGQPVPALDVLLRQVRAMHAGLVAAEVGDAPQVGQKSFAVDLGHGPQPRRAATQAAMERSRSSSWRRPTSCTPSGRPFGPVPAGRVTHGWPESVQIELKRGSPVTP